MNFIKKSNYVIRIGSFFYKRVIRIESFFYRRKAVPKHAFIIIVTINLYILNYSTLKFFNIIENLRSSNLFIIQIHIHFFIVNLFDDIFLKIIRKV